MVTVSRSVALIVGASLIAMSGARAAQDAAKPAEPPELAEVVVSVERVTQTLQSYAGTAVTATQAELDSLGATNLVDLPSVLPGVEISNYEDNTNIYVRGIGSDANTELGDPAVAPHLDDVYVARPRGLQVAFFDIDRVEVNVGPQGTIRGRNALGHAALIDRYRGYLDGLQTCGLKLDKTLVVQGYNSHASGVQSARKLLNVAPAKRPTAIFASNDEMAAGALTVAHSMGLGVPEDISIAGFDDAPLASQVWPALTTIRQPIPDMAAQAAELLLSALGVEPADHSKHVLPSSLMFRQSTGPAPNRARHQGSKPEGRGLKRA